MTRSLRPSPALGAAAALALLAGCRGPSCCDADDCSWSAPVVAYDPSTGRIPPAPTVDLEHPTALPPADWYAGAALSLLPNVGVAVEAGKVVRRDAFATWSVEAQALWQFLDDKTFADDGNPVAGDWYQARVGAKVSTDPDDYRHWTGRLGFVWFRAEGEPNLVQEEGDYFGGYVGVGFETQVNDRFTIGPEVSVMVVPRDGGDPPFYAVPQFGWHLLWEFPCRSAYEIRYAPVGDVYAALGASAVPGLGLSATMGQVFCRDPRVTWSFEASAAVQRLVFDGDGELAFLRGGVKASLSPDCASHWVGRAGPAWFRATENSAPFVDDAGDFFGGYASVGHEWDLTPHVSTGPEAGVLLGIEEKQGDFQALPFLCWHLILKF
jgi:hypothetical protein